MFGIIGKYESGGINHRGHRDHRGGEEMRPRARGEGWSDGMVEGRENEHGWTGWPGLGIGRGKGTKGGVGALWCTRGE